VASEPFDIGDDVVLTLAFTVAGVATDPTTETCVVVDPAGTETVVTLTKQSTGVFTGTFTPTVAGEHWFRGSGTGAAKAAGESVFSVRKRRVP
jgi:hypothetical protein